MRLTTKTKKHLQALEGRRNKLLRKQHKEKPHKRVLTLKRGLHTKDPVYLSGRYVEYFIKVNDVGFYYIRRYRGGRETPALMGQWTNHRDAEKVLIDWLEATDKRQQSRYPGCPERKATNYTQTFLKD